VLLVEVEAVMADVSKRGTSPWVAFLAGAVAVLALMLAIFGLQGGQHVAEGIAASFRAAPDLPKLPPMPEGPRVPGAPIPKPQ
jgi:hypothetical protein